MIFISRQVPKTIGKPPNVYIGVRWKQIAVIDDDNALDIAIDYCRNNTGKFMIDINTPEFKPIFIPSLGV